MAITVLTGLAEEWFTPEDERGEDTPTRFKIRPLNGMEFLEVMAEGEQVGDSFVTNHAGRTLLLRRGLVDWENLLEENGRPLKFSVHNLAKIPANILAELSNEIMQRSALAMEEKKV